MKIGPKPKYKEDYPRMARVACEEGGFTDVKLAKLFGVSKSLINNWKHDHPEFLVAIKAGKEAFDTEHVEKALLKRALGFSYDETTKELIDNLDPLTKEEKPLIMGAVKKVRKKVAGDVKAQTFWLRNRNRERWPDTTKFDGALGVTVSHEDLLDMLDE